MALSTVPRHVKALVTVGTLAAATLGTLFIVNGDGATPQAGSIVDCVQTQTIINGATVDSYASPPCSTTPPTSSSSSTTTTAPATTTTAPQAGSVTYTFDAASGPAGRNGALPLSDFSVSRWRMDGTNPPVPNTQGNGPALPGDVRIENGRVVVESGMQNYGDTEVRLNRPFTGNTISLDATLDRVTDSSGYTRLIFADAPMGGISYGGDNANGPTPANGFDLRFTGLGGCPIMDRWVNYVQTTITGDGQPVGPFNCTGTPVDISPGVSHHVVVTLGAQVMVTVDGGEMAMFPASPISTSWFSFGVHNHATQKYQSKPTVTNSFDNVSLTAGQAGSVAQVPNSGGVTFGYPLTGSVVDLPATTPLATNGATQAWLVVDVATDPNPASNSDSATLQYRLNGHTVHTVPFNTVGRVIVTRNQSFSIPVDLNELVAGPNTIGLGVTITAGGNMSVANVDLVVQGGSTPPPPTTTTATTVPATSSTAAPTTVPAPTTTQGPTTTAGPTTTVAGSLFSENFASATALTDRFDHGWSGPWDSGSLFGENKNDWPADHDMACGDPNMTHRTIHLPGPFVDPNNPANNRTGEQTAGDVAFFPCTFSGDAAKSHLMTSVNTDGYVTAWFAPKQVFANVHKVCWDQNVTAEGGGRWTIVNFLTPSEYQGQTDLGLTSPDFPANGGPSSPRGSAQNGVKVQDDGMRAYTNGQFVPGTGGQFANVQGVREVADKAGRYQHCVIDNENGTLTLTLAQPTGPVLTATVQGAIPNGSIKVEFADDNYNPDKHCTGNSTPTVACPNPDANGGVPTNTVHSYTWHWDNILVA